MLLFFYFGKIVHFGQIYIHDIARGALFLELLQISLSLQ
jgi:hypothetical protein